MVSNTEMPQHSKHYANVKKSDGHIPEYPDGTEILDYFYGSHRACRGGLTSLYYWHRMSLYNAIDDQRPFDTGWQDCDGTDRSFRIQSNGVSLLISACTKEDDDLLELALHVGYGDSAHRPSDEELKLLKEIYLSERSVPLVTKFVATAEIPITTPRATMEALRQLDEKIDEDKHNTLKEISEWAKSITPEILQQRRKKVGKRDTDQKRTPVRH